MNLELLKAPFAPSEVSWRIGQAGEGRNGIWAKVLAYIDNRCIQDRLDSVCGPENWRNEKPEPGPSGGVIQGISIKIGGEWITKWDGADNTDIEPVKGGLSDSMKRAAVLWGIGRYLYDLGENWAEVFDDRKEGAHYANCKIKSGGQEKYIQFYWLPPRLPDFALPSKQPPPAPQPHGNGKKSKAKEVAEQHGMKTADELVRPIYKAAIQRIEAAVRDRNVEDLEKVASISDTSHGEGKLTDNEHSSINHECTLALRKIKALETEPVGAGA